MLARLGVELLDLGVVKDEPAALEAAFRQAAESADAVITSGGVSVGEADYTKRIMAELGEVLFWKIAMRPGRPMAIGRIRARSPAADMTIAGQVAGEGRIRSDGKHAILFGLPGNPVAVMVTFYAFVREALLAMSGAAAEPLPMGAGRCASPAARARASCAA
jgi:molybdopterin molybdotransferase